MCRNGCLTSVFLFKQGFEPCQLALTPNPCKMFPIIPKYLQFSLVWVNMTEEEQQSFNKKTITVLAYLREGKSETFAEMKTRGSNPSKPDINP